MLPAQKGGSKFLSAVRKNVSGALFAVYTHIPAEEFNVEGELTRGRIGSRSVADHGGIKFDLGGLITAVEWRVINENSLGVRFFRTHFPATYC